MKSSINVSKENNKENESAKPNPIIEKIKKQKQKWEISNIIANNLWSNCDIIKLDINGKQQITTTKQTLLKYI